MNGFGRAGVGLHKGLILLMVFLTTQGVAAAFTAPKVEYSADQYMGNGKQMVKSRIYQASEKSRMEFEEGGGQQAIITRLDRKVIWTLIIPEKMYMEHPIGKEEKTRDVRQCSAVSTKDVGKETVNGISATVSEVEATCPDGSGFSGKVWTSRDGIMVKMDAVSKGAGNGKGQRVVMEVKNLKIGKQDPALFELPPGFAKLEVPTGMPSLKDFQPKETKQEPPPQAQPQTQPTGMNYTAQQREKEKTVLDKAVETKDKVKRLFNW
jgi:hypothetical protein